MALRSVKVGWIDDDPDHENDARLLENRALKIDFVRPFDLPAQVIDWKRRRTIPHLFVVDYSLNLIPGTDGKRFNRKGISLAGELREHFPDRPIYGFSARGKEDGLFGELRISADEAFDIIMEFKELQREGTRVFVNDARDYLRIKEGFQRRISLGGMVGLMAIPPVSVSEFERVLPGAFRAPLETPTGPTALSFARWLRRVLLVSPGPLHDGFYTATQVGLTQEGFDRKEKAFERALYRGPFSISTPKLWWAREVDEIVLSLAKAAGMESGSPSSLGPSLLNATKDMLAVCIVCKNPYPDTVGFDLEGRHREPVHFSCSVLHPTMDKVQYFDQPRLYVRGKS